MGWLAKAFLVFLAIAFFGIGLWFLSLPIFAYLVYSMRPGRRKAGRMILVTPQSEDGAGGIAAARVSGGGRMRASRFEWHWRYLIGVSLLVVALVSVGAHGTYSPLVFGGVGLLLLLWAPISKSGHFPTAGLTPVRESTVLTKRFLPFAWLTVAEVKFSTEEAIRALTVLRDNLIVTASNSEKPGIFLVIQVTASSYRSAEAQIADRLHRLASVLANRGAYLLPLDSGEVVNRFQKRLEPLNLELEDNVVATIGHSPYDVLVVKPDGAHAKSLGAYVRAAPTIGAGEIEAEIAEDKSRKKGSSSVVGLATLPRPRQKFERQPLLWEVISSLQERFRFSDPDSLTMFLNNMHLSRNAPLGQKLNLVSGGTEEGKAKGATVTVESLAGTPVELSRAQLRAIVKIYG
ncbi:MAG: hypothetical protein OK455_04335 [Thaumarchaeota archaeon]|nr:hypothetical protein [Nitrososphaerota archaeon]